MSLAIYGLWCLSLSDFRVFFGLSHKVTSLTKLFWYLILSINPQKMTNSQTLLLKFLVFDFEYPNNGKSGFTTRVLSESFPQQLSENSRSRRTIRPSSCRLVPFLPIVKWTVCFWGAYLISDDCYYPPRSICWPGLIRFWEPCARRGRQNTNSYFTQIEMWTTRSIKGTFFCDTFTVVIEITLIRRILEI